MSVTSYQNVSNSRIKPFQINEITSLEKKMKFCDRPLGTMKEKHSGKQITVEVQTVVYEYIKNHCITILEQSGPIKCIQNPVEGKDLNNANIEIQ